MNLIALATLNAYIALELQALQVLTAYQIRVRGYNTYTALAHKINRSLVGCTVIYFRLFLTDLECFADVQQIDLELPIMSEIISAYDDRVYTYNAFQHMTAKLFSFYADLFPKFSFFSVLRLDKKECLDALLDLSIQVRGAILTFSDDIQCKQGHRIYCHVTERWLYYKSDSVYYTIEGVIPNYDGWKSVSV